MVETEVPFPLMWINGEARQGQRASDEPPGRLRGGQSDQRQSKPEHCRPPCTSVCVASRRAFPNEIRRNE